MSRRRKLSSEEKSLWDVVRKTATPLRDTTAMPEMPEADANPSPPKTARPREPLTPFSLGTKSGRVPPRHDLAPSVSERLSKAPVSMDHKHFSKMSKGKLSPEARIDLHGMTQAEAHPILTGFILTAHAQGRRLVLVITGKGKRRDEGGPIPVRTGVLKHQVPHWLSIPPLKGLVLQVSEAHLKHGGTGAYYVYLRRKR